MAPRQDAQVAGKGDRLACEESLWYSEESCLAGGMFVCTPTRGQPHLSLPLGSRADQMTPSRQGAEPLENILDELKFAPVGVK